MTKKKKRQIKVVNIPDLQTIIDLGDAHAATLIVLANVEVSSEAEPYILKARFILSETYKSIAKQYEALTGSPFVIDYLEDAFRAKPMQSFSEAEKARSISEEYMNLELASEGFNLDRNTAEVLDV